MDKREKRRYVFPSGQRHLVKYKLISKTISVPETIFDAAILDLSEEGACLQGDLDDKYLYDLGVGAIQLGCNIYLNKMVKVRAIVRWFKKLAETEHQFGVAFDLTDEAHLEIQRFLIRHQLDTRRFKRSQLLP